MGVKHEKFKDNETARYICCYGFVHTGMRVYDWTIKIPAFAGVFMRFYPVPGIYAQRDNLRIVVAVRGMYNGRAIP